MQAQIKQKLVNDAVISWAHNFNTYGEKLSAPQALIRSNLDTILNTSQLLRHIPTTEMIFTNIRNVGQFIVTKELVKLG